MNKTNNSDIGSLINDLENSIREVNSIYGEIECGNGTIGYFGIIIAGCRTNFKQDLMQKNKDIIELLTNMDKQLDLEPIVPGLPWKFKLKNTFNFVKEIFFCVTGIRMWISAFKEIKTKWKEPAYGSITLAIFKSLAALFIPAVFVGLVLSIVHVIIPVIVIASLLALPLSILIYQYVDDKIEGTNERSMLMRETNQKNRQIQRRNEVRNKYQEEISNFRSLYQKYIKEYEPYNFNESEPMNDKQNLNMQTENKDKNKTGVIKDVNDQNLKKDEKQKDNKECPKLASLHVGGTDPKIHGSTEQNNEL